MSTKAEMTPEERRQVEEIEKETEQILAEGRNIRKEDVTLTRGMVKMAVDSRNIGATTLRSLNEQGEQLDRIEGKQETIQGHMDQADVHLNKLEKWFLFCVPRYSNKKLKKQIKARKEERERQDQLKAEQQRQQQELLQPKEAPLSEYTPGGAGRRGLNLDQVQAPTEHQKNRTWLHPRGPTEEDQEREINQNIDIVGDMVREMRLQSEQMGKTIVEHNEQLDRINTKVDRNQEDVQAASTRTSKIKTGLFHL